MSGFAQQFASNLLIADGVSSAPGPNAGGRFVHIGEDS